MTSPPTHQGPYSPAGHIEPGTVIGGKYRVDKVLGAGGMGVVLAAYHLQLDERVAIKLLLPEMLGNPEAVARFAREARAAVKIKSEHVARVSDVGTLEDGSPFMVMEFLEGQDLSAWVANQGVLPIEQAVEFAVQACEALAEAHALGIVHRDLKPANLFCVMRADGLLSIKVLDFGISKASLGGGSDMGMTKTTAVMGSPLYMSPEQMESARNVDARGDIWAMGAILYELLTARTPFVADSLPGLVLQIATAAPQPLRTFRPETPPELEAVILRCLEKDRTRRYQNVAELAIALVGYGPRRSRTSVERISRVIQGAGLSASALALPPSNDVPSTRTHGGTQAAFGQTAGELPAKRGFTYALLGLAGVGVVVAASVLWLGSRSSPAVPPLVPLASAAHEDVRRVEQAATAASPQPAAVASVAAAVAAPSSTPSSSASAPASPMTPMTTKPPRTVKTVARRSAATASPSPAARPATSPSNPPKGSSLGGRL